VGGPGGGVSPGPRTGFINAGFIHFEGLIAGASYRLDLQDFGATWFDNNPGAINFKFDFFHEARRNTSVTGLGFDLVRSAGTIGDPKFSYNAQAEYVRGPLTATWTANFISQSSFNNDFTLETRFPLTVKPYYLHDLAFTYDLTSWAEKAHIGLTGARARFSVKNVFDTEPPFGTTGIGVYDVIGRFYQFGLTGRF
jgi:hypothetical protein